MKVVLASNNQGKLQEFQRLLNQTGWDIHKQSTFNTPEADETGLSFVENAIIKARNAALHSHLPAIADDSGIEVDALRGKPGIHSARYAGDHADDQANNEKLLADLKHVPLAQRTARFRCCIVYMRHAEDPSPLIADASWEGHILTAPKGDNGFGYDPLFYVPSHQCSSAQLTAKEKSRISHRALAIQTLLTLLEKTA